MGDDFKQALALLNAIASCRERIIEFVLALRSNVEVVEVLDGIDLRSLQTGPTLEMYAEARLRNRKAICWWLEANWNESLFTIESYVTTVHLDLDENTKKILSFSDKHAKTISEAVTQLEKATVELMNSINSMNF